MATASLSMAFAPCPMAMAKLLLAVWASGHGAGQVMDGLGMLAEQAAEAFYLWRGMRPDTAPALAELRRLLTL